MTVDRVLIENVEPSSVAAAAVIGVGATTVVDLWTLLLKHLFKIPSLSYCLVGRWFCHMPAGKFAHDRLATAPEKPFECTVGWISHYVIGVVFALVFVALASDGWLARPTLLPALLFGLATVLFPFLVMQPAFGLGVAASKSPKPAAARLKSVTTHLVFGLGLFVSALALGELL
jgi:hypothetical protein